MKRVMLAVGVLAALLAPGSAFAWNCSDPLAERVSVPPTTTGTFGDADGQLANFGGLVYECEVVKPTPPTPPTPPSTTNTNTNSNSNSNANSNSNSNKNTSKSTSTSSATGGAGGNSTSSATGGTSNATGGSVKNSGNSTLKNSGNSSNTNSNSATGGQGGAGGQGGPPKQGQTQTTASTANGNGNGNGVGANNSTYAPSSVTNVAADKIPVASAYAPTSIPTVTCFKPIGAGAQTSSFGISIGGGKIDGGCDSREFARSYALLGARIAACKMLVAEKKSKKAGVTLEDCLAVVEPVVEAVPVQAPIIPNIVVEVATPAVAAVAQALPPPSVVVSPTRHLVGICTFATNQVLCAQPGKPDEVQVIKPINIYKPTRVTSICQSMLDAAIIELRENPDENIYIVGNQNRSETGLVRNARANEARAYLENHGYVSSKRVITSVGTSTDRTVELWIGTE